LISWSQHLNTSTYRFSYEKHCRSIFYLYICCLKIEIVFWFEASRLWKLNCNEISLISVIISGKISIVINLVQALTVKLDFNLNIRIVLGHVLTFNVEKVYQVIKWFISVYLSNKLIIQIDFVKVPTNKCLSEINTQYFSWKCEIGVLYIISNSLEYVVTFIL
jgi:hypothetical protein